MDATAHATSYPGNVHTRAIVQIMASDLARLAFFVREYSGLHAHSRVSASASLLAERARIDAQYSVDHLNRG